LVITQRGRCAPCRRDKRVIVRGGKRSSGPGLEVTIGDITGTFLLSEG
jgi:hypothetical protein